MYINKHGGSRFCDNANALFLRLEVYNIFSSITFLTKESASKVNFYVYRNEIAQGIFTAQEIDSRDLHTKSVCIGASGIQIHKLLRSETISGVDFRLTVTVKVSNDKQIRFSNHVLTLPKRIS